MGWGRRVSLQVEGVQDLSGGAGLVVRAQAVSQPHRRVPGPEGPGPVLQMGACRVLAGGGAVGAGGFGCGDVDVVPDPPLLHPASSNNPKAAARREEQGAFMLTCLFAWSME